VDVVSCESFLDAAVCWMHISWTSGFMFIITDALHFVRKVEETYEEFHDKGT